MKKSFSKIMKTHISKFIYRSALFLLCLIMYVAQRIINPNLVVRENIPLLVCFGLAWLLVLIDMIIRLFPTSSESMGCQKKYKKNYIEPEEKGDLKKSKTSPISVLLIALAWIGLNGLFGVLYFFKIFDQSILMLIGLAYSICDVICILFFCPFQTWFMKNKCCTTCRIYNWDYFMMCTPLIFVPNYRDMRLFDFIVLGLFLISILILAKWEITYAFKKERFVEATNDTLKCQNCKEKLCIHKPQLRRFLKRYRAKNK